MDQEVVQEMEGPVPAARGVALVVQVAEAELVDQAADQVLEDQVVQVLVVDQVDQVPVVAEQDLEAADQVDLVVDQVDQVVALAVQEAADLVVQAVVVDQEVVVQDQVPEAGLVQVRGNQFSATFNRNAQMLLRVAFVFFFITRIGLKAKRGNHRPGFFFGTFVVLPAGFIYSNIAITSLL
jgi:hypothetical protein